MSLSGIYLDLVNFGDMQEEFDTWNTIKKSLDKSSAPLSPEHFPKKGDVWMVSLGKNIGFEQSGSGEGFSRPVIVIQKINNHMFWCVPLSSKQKPLHFYFNFTDPNNQQVSAILGQLKLISIKRFQREMYEIPWETFDNIKAELRKLLG